MPQPKKIDFTRLWITVEEADRRVQNWPPLKETGLVREAPTNGNGTQAPDTKDAKSAGKSGRSVHSHKK